MQAEVDYEFNHVQIALYEMGLRGPALTFTL